MKRRDLFGRLAAVAAAVALAPAAAVQVEAAPEYGTATIITTPEIGVPVDAALWVQGTTILDGDLIVNGRNLNDLLAEAAPLSPWGTTYTTAQLNEIRTWVSEARAEGYERREFVEAMRAESRAMRVMRQ